MPTHSLETPFMVDAYSDPVCIIIRGRASFLNCAPLNDFVKGMISEDKKRFVFDFKNCTGIDSTFMGILAGVALDVRESNPPGSVILCRMGARNLELVRNLGLHRLMLVDAGEFEMSFDGVEENLSAVEQCEIDNAKMILRAHESLLKADESNQSKFQDVISFLKNQVMES
jgi:anti-sigma B factor antagonist